MPLGAEGQLLIHIEWIGGGDAGAVAKVVPAMSDGVLLRPFRRGGPPGLRRAHGDNVGQQRVRRHTPVLVWHLVREVRRWARGAGVRRRFQAQACALAPAAVVFSARVALVVASAAPGAEGPVARALALKASQYLPWEPRYRVRH